jgi:hypothetical protein
MKPAHLTAARSFSRFRALTKSSRNPPDGVRRVVRAQTPALSFPVGAHAPRATTATNALDPEADIAKEQ